MKVVQTWNKHQPDTTTGSAITVSFTYQGTEDELKEIEDWCKQNISTARVIEETDADE